MSGEHITSSFARPIPLRQLTSVTPYVYDNSELVLASTDPDGQVERRRYHVSDIRNMIALLTRMAESAEKK